MSIRPVTFIAGVVAAIVVVTGCTGSSEPQDPKPSDQEPAVSANKLCAQRPDAASPSQREIGELDIEWVVACRWRNADMYSRRIESGPAGALFLSEQQQLELTSVLADAPRSRPDCMLIDSPPPLSYVVILRDAAGQHWEVVVPNTPCAGFAMDGALRETDKVAPLLGTWTASAAIN